MATYFPDGLTHGAVLPDVAAKLFSLGASQCWASPQEAEAAQGPFAFAIPDGFVDECDDGASTFFRVWYEGSCSWLNAYAKSVGRFN